MFKRITLLLLLIGSTSLIAQIETVNPTVRFDLIEQEYKSPKGYEFPAIEMPRITNPKDPFYRNNFSNLGLEMPEDLDISTDEGYENLISDNAPKYFQMEKEIKEEYYQDQHFGSFTTTAKFVNVLYRDHEYVDGDRIRVIVNGDILQSNIYLNGSFRGFTLVLDKGVNRIEFMALNQGSSGPNTAQFKVFDENENVVSSNKWNLTTGGKAIVVIVKE
jgi:hypothetical protein